MARTVLIMVSDNQASVEDAKRYWENRDVTVQVYSPAQWREGLENSFFRQQLVQGVPALTPGSQAPGTFSGNVLPFPTAPTANVQKMDDLEAKAIQNAIEQYKGNLTEAAKALGIGRATLYRKVKQYHLDPSAARKKKVVAA